MLSYWNKTLLSLNFYVMSLNAIKYTAKLGKKTEKSKTEAVV